jgi:hypothetical protein
MNKLYDNGEILLGRKKDIVNQIYNNMLVEENDEEYTEILEDIKDFEDNTILAINYDNGMGYSIDVWEEKDEVKQNEY